LSKIERWVQRQQHQDRHDHSPQPDSAGAPALHPDRLGRGRQQPHEFAVQVTALGAQHPPQLGRQRQAAGGGEPLADLVDAELPQRPPVHLLSAGAQGQAQHHVGQVDRLPPRAGAGLHQGHVDQQQPPVAHQCYQLDLTTLFAGRRPCQDHRSPWQDRAYAPVRAFADATLDFLPHDRAAAYVGEQTGLSLYGAAVSCPGG